MPNGQALRAGRSTTPAPEKPEPAILFQKFFKSVGPRTYAVQIKEAANGNHFLVLTEGRRDPKTDELRKTKLLVFSEDFQAFFRMLHEAVQFIRTHPVPPEVRKRREQYWAKRTSEPTPPPQPAKPVARPVQTTRRAATPTPRSQPATSRPARNARGR